MNVRKIAIFASGSGTNAQNIIQYFAGKQGVVVDSLWSNTPTAFALQRAANYGIDTFVFNREELNNSPKIVQNLKEREIDLIVLAGFLWLIPVDLIRNFRIINIHPALLPKYGGKGMYGTRVHEAVIHNKEKQTGVSIHYVNENYDEGQIISQKKVDVLKQDTVQTLEARIKEIEKGFLLETLLKILN